MNQPNAPTSPSFWNLCVTSAPKAPWRGFFFGLFLPMMLMQVSSAFGKPLLGVALALGACVVFFIVDTRRTKQLCVFPLITFFMTATQFAAGMFAFRHPDWTALTVITPVVDDATLAVIFLGSLATKTPLILAMLDRETLDKIPGNIRRSSYYLHGWRLVTLLWGVIYVIQPIILAALFFHHVPGAEAIDYMLGWPIVVPCLVLSVAIPRWYWIRNMRRIEEEVGA